MLEKELTYQVCRDEYILGDGAPGHGYVVMVVASWVEIHTNEGPFTSE